MECVWIEGNNRHSLRWQLRWLKLPLNVAQRKILLDLLKIPCHPATGNGTKRNGTGGGVGNGGTKQKKRQSESEIWGEGGVGQRTIE